MKLWLLRRLQDRPMYDVCDGFVIRAADELGARLMASDEAQDEGKACWLSRETASCVELTASGAEEVVLMDCNPG